MVVHYAQLAESLGVEGFLISHELETANKFCAELWYDILAGTRAVFNGTVSAAFEPSVIDNLPLIPWANAKLGRPALDYVGIDCYFALPNLPPGYDGTNHTELPWQDLPLDTLLASGAQLMPALANFSAHSGQQVMCTEVGWMARPWTWS
jgi:hypothetical protein